MWWLIDTREHLRSVEQNLYKFYNLTSALGSCKESDIDKFFKQYSNNIYNMGVIIYGEQITENIRDVSIANNALNINVVFNISELLNRLGQYRFTYRLDNNTVISITRYGYSIQVKDLKFIRDSYITFKPIVFGYKDKQKIVFPLDHYHYVKSGKISKVNIISNHNVIVEDNEVTTKLIIYKYMNYQRGKIPLVNTVITTAKIYALTCLPHIPTNKIFDIKQLTQLTVSIERDEYLNLITELINVTNNNPKLQFIKCRYRRRNIECQFRDDRFNYVFLISVDFYKRLK